MIGEVGTILGAHGINIANFALGRNAAGAVGVVNVDAMTADVMASLVRDIRAVRAVKEAWAIAV